MKIAISGKGGVGKTTIAAGLACYLKDQGYKVYAIDADPDANLAAMLGFKGEVKPLVELREVISEKVGGKGGLYTLNPDVDDVLKDYSIDHCGIKLLRMGSVKRAGSACYCPENSFLQAVLNTLIFSREEVVIMDMGAGIEHLTRGTASGVDQMLIVCEPSRISIATAKTINDLDLEAGVSRVNFIANKVRSAREMQFMRENLPANPVAFITYKDEFLQMGMTEGEGAQPVTEEMGVIAEALSLLEEKQRS